MNQSHALVVDRFFVLRGSLRTDEVDDAINHLFFMTLRVEDDRYSLGGVDSLGQTEFQPEMADGLPAQAVEENVAGYHVKMVR